MATKKTTRKESTLAAGRAQVVLVLDQDVLDAVESHAAGVRLKRNALIQLAIIEYLKGHGSWSAAPEKQK